MYLSVGISGYIAFGDRTLEDVLNNFSPSYPLAMATRVGLTLLLISAFPKAQFALRDGLIKFANGEHASIDSIPFWQVALWPALIVPVATLIGVVVTNIEYIEVQQGSIFCSLIMYIIPSIMFASLLAQNGLILTDNHELKTDDVESEQGGPTVDTVDSGAVTKREHDGGADDVEKEENPTSATEQFPDGWLRRAETKGDTVEEIKHDGNAGSAQKIEDPACANEQLADGWLRRAETYRESPIETNNMKEHIPVADAFHGAETKDELCGEEAGTCDKTNEESHLMQENEQTCDSEEPTLGMILKSMFTSCKYWVCTMLLVWGLASMVVGIAAGILWKIPNQHFAKSINS